MKERLLMVEFIKRVSYRICGKEVFFYDYDSKQWYSRLHGGYVPCECILEWIEDNLQDLLLDEAV